MQEKYTKALAICDDMISNHRAQIQTLQALKISLIARDREEEDTQSLDTENSSPAGTPDPENGT